MSWRRNVAFWAVLFMLVFIFASACAEAASDDVVDISEDEAAALAAEEAAAAAVGEAAEDEEEDDADALDEDADSARPDFERRHPLTDLPPSAADVDVGHAFYPDLKSGRLSDAIADVTLGKPIKAVVGFANRGRMQYHVWGVMGSLNMDNKFSTYVQNFTYGTVNKTVSAGEELSFTYKFTPNERLDTRKFQLALSVFYEARGSSGNAIRGHSTTFFNSTIATEAGPQTVSNGMFMVMMAVLVGAGIGAIYVFRNAEAKKVSQTESGTEVESKNEWLEEHQQMVRTGGGRARSRGKASTRS